jgi:hypothetical protein
VRVPYPKFYIYCAGEGYGENAAEVKNKSDKILVAEDDEASNPIILRLLEPKLVALRLVNSILTKSV